MPGQSRKYPWDDLARKANVPIHCSYHPQPTRMDYARHFNVGPQTIDRWMRHGVPWYMADRIAIKILGIHPAAIWPEWFDDEAAA